MFRSFLRQNPSSKVFIDVNCSQFVYSSPVSSFVEHTLEQEEIRRRGYKNEKERMEELRRLAPGLDDLQLMLNVCNFYGGLGLSSRGTANGRTYPLLEERCKIDQRSHDYTCIVGESEFASGNRFLGEYFSEFSRVFF